MAILPYYKSSIAMTSWTQLAISTNEKGREGSPLVTHKKALYWGAWDLHKSHVG